MLWVACAIFVAVMVLLVIALWKGRREGGGALNAMDSRKLVVVAGVAIPLAILIVLVGGSLMLGRSIAAHPPDDALNIRVTGWMWWWEIEYLDQQGRTLATTANELHVPVGQPVALHLTSADVIHSFWVPELHGKTDLVPGTVNSSWFTAERSGVHRGQCAEFCGAQHALMAFLVIAEEPDEFEQWLNQQTQPARAPTNEQAERGQAVFLSAGCATCHTVRGTAAAGQQGPDLTHIAGRRTLAAAARPNTPGHLGGWVSDPQGVKPGSFMPRTLLEPSELTALIAYLDSLQ